MNLKLGIILLICATICIIRADDASGLKKEKDISDVGVIDTIAERSASLIQKECDPNSPSSSGCSDLQSRQARAVDPKKRKAKHPKNKESNEDAGILFDKRKSPKPSNKKSPNSRKQSKARKSHNSRKNNKARKSKNARKQSKASRGKKSRKSKKPVGNSRIDAHEE